MEKLCKTQGIILRRINFGEADQILTVLTRDYGKISLLAKGARRIKSKFCGRLELFYQVELVYFQGRTLHHLNEVEMLSCMTLSDLDLRGSSILFYIMEATSRLLPEGQEASDIFDLLSDSLNQLDTDSDINDLILYAYLTKLLSHLGFMGSFEECARSNVKLNLSEPIYLSSKDASLVRSGYADASDTKLTPAVIKWVNYMQKEDLEALKKVRPSQNEKIEVFYVMQSIFANILGTSLRSESFLLRSQQVHFKKELVLD